MKDLYVVSVICLYVFIAVSLEAQTLEVPPGENITLSCLNISKEETQIEWFRVENGTKATCISSMLETDKPVYCTGFTSGKYRMSSNGTNVFLTIQHVDYSDSGLYFCGIFVTSNIVLSETTSLSVQGPPEPTGTPHSQAGSTTSKISLLVAILGCLSVVFAVVSIALVIRIVQLQKANNILQARKNELSSDDLNYAALNIKTPKRHGAQISPRQTDPHVIYASTR